MRKYSSQLFARIILLIVSSQVLMSCYSYKPLVKNQSSKPMNEIVQKISPDKIYMIKLKTGNTVKMKVTKVDDEKIYGMLFQKNLKGKEIKYENNMVEIADVGDIRVWKSDAAGTIVVIALPIGLLVLYGVEVSEHLNENFP